MEGAELKALLGEAVDAAREYPEAERDEVIAGVLQRAESVEPNQTDQIKREAVDRLRRAAEKSDELGDHPDAPLVNATVGVGLAILGSSEDAEYFYSLFAGYHGARIETYSS